MGRNHKEQKQEQWKRLMVEFGDSSQSASAFSRARQINYKTFYYWKKKLEPNAIKSRPPRQVSKPTFLPVSIQENNVEPVISRGLPNAKWVAEFAAHFVRNLL